MEYCEKSLNNFTVIYSKDWSNSNKTTFSSSSSSTSSNSSCIDTGTRASQIINASPPISSAEYSALEKLSRQSKITEERKKEISKKKEEKLILKYQMEEAAKFHAVAVSKCGRFVKYDCKIGEGGYKVVYKGFDKEAYRAVAWCEVKREHLNSKDKNQSMLKEIEIMVKLDHPHVVKCYTVLNDWWLLRDDFEEKRCEAKGLVIIQELMGAGTLKEMIKKNFQDGRCILDTRLITRWLYQIVDVLRYMHCKIQPPIIHRDVKSENCFLVEQAGEDFVNVKIGDFGLATTINQNSHRKTMIGTVGFMAPEVYEEKYDIKVDIYAFGMMVLEVMTNKTPYHDCTNVFQVVSKSMGSHLPDVISIITQPLIKEMILACVHPVPTYRPTAEELCEHPIFQNTPLIVNPMPSDMPRSDAISAAIRKLSTKIKSPIIDIIICANNDFIEDNNDLIDFSAVTFSLDVYQAQDCNLCEFMAVYNSYGENEFKTSPKKLNKFKKFSHSIRLQIQYLIKLINGERWRNIFDEFFILDGEERRCHRSNSTPNQCNVLPEVPQLIPTNSLTSGTAGKYTNNFAEYSHNVSIYHKATRALDLEMEKYCHESTKNGLPYFFNFSSQLQKSNDKRSGNHTRIGASLSEQSEDPSKMNFNINEYKKTDENRQEILSTTDLIHISNDDVFLSSTVKESTEIVNRFLKAEVYSSADNEEVLIPFIFDHQMGTLSNQERYNNGYNSSNSSQVQEKERGHCQPRFQQNNCIALPVEGKMNVSYNQNSADGVSSVGYNYFQSSYVNELGDSYTPNCNLQMIYTSPARNNKPSWSNSILTEATSLHSYYPHIVLNQEQSAQKDYIDNYNLLAPIGPCNNLYFQQQSQEFINYGQPRVGANQLIFSSKDIDDVYNGLYYKQGQLTRPDSRLMQSNTPYIVSKDPTFLTPVSMSQPVLTRSLPSIVGSVPAYVDHVVVCDNHQSNVSSAANSGNSQFRVPMIPVVGGNADSQRQNPTLNCSQNQPHSPKLTHPVISTTKSFATHSQQNYSTVISNSKVLDKSKKKTKSRLKSKYLLKIINIEESAIGETNLTFEMTLHIQQMRFTCRLSNEINAPDVSTSVGKYGQIPGELHKEGILDSLVLTVKKICQHLTKDIHSIPLNEEYIFHPCLSNFDLIKLSDQLQLDVDLSPYLVSNQSSISSRPISRAPSHEDVSRSLVNISEQFSGHCPETEHDRKSGIKVAHENGSKLHTIVCTRCACQTEESTLKVPDYLFNTVKQVIEKLQNPHCKGLIALQQSIDIFTRNIRVLEIPADHMFVGLPCHDSSYNVIKGEKTKDFIIARDNRDSDNVTDKCLYQIPNDRAVLLDSSGEIQFIKTPSLVIPAMPGHQHEKTTIKELPTELTHHRDHILDFNQILSVLESMTHIQHSSEQSHDDFFDNPVLLEPVKPLFRKSHSNIVDRSDAADHRRGSHDCLTPNCQPQSQVQVERIFCKYVAQLKPDDGQHESLGCVADNMERDLPNQQVQSRKISNDSRTNETDQIFMQSQPGFHKVLSNEQINFQNCQRNPQVGAVVNRMPYVHGSSSGQFILPNQYPMGLNYSQRLPNQILMHQIQQNYAMRMAMPLSMSSNFPGTTLHGLQQNMMTTSSHIHPTQLPYPSNINEPLLSYVGHEMIPGTVHQVPHMSSQTFPEVLVADNSRLHHKGTSQTVPGLIIPALTSVISQSNVVPMAVGVPSLKTSEPSVTMLAHESRSFLDSIPNPKIEQTVGRFVVRSVTGSTDTS